MSARNHVPVVQQVVEKMKEYLFSGDLSEGEHLPSEKELCQKMSVSRNSLREALRILAASGYIVQKPGRGAFVLRTREYDEEESVISWFTRNELDVQDYLEVRSVCEPLATRLAIQRCTPQDLERLHKIHAAFLKAVEEKNAQEIFIQEGNFHNTIIDLSKNELLINIFKVIQKQIVDFRHQSLRLPNAPQDAIIPHARIVRAFDLGDADFGEAAMREHVKLAIFNVRCSVLDQELIFKTDAGNSRADNSGPASK